MIVFGIFPQYEWKLCVFANEVSVSEGDKDVSSYRKDQGLSQIYLGLVFVLVSLKGDYHW